MRHERRTVASIALTTVLLRRHNRLIAFCRSASGPLALLSGGWSTSVSKPRNRKGKKLTNRQPLKIAVDAEAVSAILLCPPDAKALYLFAHGAGAGMDHHAMESNAQGLAARGIATLRYQFLYMEKGSKRPDGPKAAHAVVRAVATKAAQLVPELPLFAGGRSFGGRMTSQTQAEEALPNVRGLAFLGFPLHPAGRPGIDRAAHLAKIAIPMIFISGSRDALAETDLLCPLVSDLGNQSRLHIVDHADHSFKVAKRSGRTPADAEAEALDALVSWISDHI